MTVTFAELGVDAQICQALERRGITDAFEIQVAAIPDALAGNDICGRAPTGSGKTLAFGIGVIDRIMNSEDPTAEPHRPSALILSPTRELADQICSELKTFSGKIRIGAVYGGVGYGPQVSGLRNGLNVVVACPGRLEDLIEQGVIELGGVTQVVIDEADRMADMGFMPGVKRILDQTASDRQTLLFSATLDGEVGKLTKAYQNNPAYHEVGETTPDITAATHLFWRASPQNRIELTAKVASRAWPCVIFCRTRHGADRLTRQLSAEGVDAVAIHGGRSQRQRTRALEDFTGHVAQALVATDVAARGIHVDGVASVVHFDPPEDHKDYVHRSGRTARAGESGLVVSLLKKGQEKFSKNLERKLGIQARPSEPNFDDMEAAIAGTTRPEKQKAKPEAKTRGGRGGSRNSSSRRSGGRSDSRSGSGGRNRDRSRGDGERSRDDERPSGRKSGASAGRKRSGEGAGSGPKRKRRGPAGESAMRSGSAKPGKRSDGPSRSSDAEGSGGPKRSGQKRPKHKARGNSGAPSSNGGPKKSSNFRGKSSGGTSARNGAAKRGPARGSKAGGGESRRPNRSKA